MAGIALILSTICMNSTCIRSSNQITYDFVANELGIESSVSIKEKKLNEIAQELNGKVLTLATLEDPPLSWTEKENGNVVIKGVVGDILSFLTEKFNFTYEVKVPKKNIIGSLTDMDGSLLELMKNEVSVQSDFFFKFFEVKNFSF